MRSAKVQFNIPPKMHVILTNKAELVGTDANDYARSLIVAAIMAEAKRPPGRPKTKPKPPPELTVTETEYSRGRDLCVLINPPKGSPPIWVEEGGGERFYQNGFPTWSDEGQSFLAEWQVQNGVKPPAGAS